jgi:anti-sigma B factor antagonist
LKLEYIKKENAVIVYLHGHVDFTVTESIEKAVDKLMSDEQSGNLLLNMKAVDYVSSAGLGLFITLMNSLQKRERKLAFCCIDQDVKKIFKVVKLTDVFDIFKTEVEALAFLKED